MPSNSAHSPASRGASDSASPAGACVAQANQTRLVPFTRRPLLDSATARPLLLTWAVICAMAVVVGATLARQSSAALWIPVGIWCAVSAASLWMWFRTPRDAGSAMAWLMTAGIGGLLVVTAVNELGLASPGLSFLPLVVLMLGLFDPQRIRITVMATLVAAFVLWLGWREGAFGTAAAVVDPAVKTLALRRVVVLLAALGTATVCGLVLAHTLRQLLMRQRDQAQAERYRKMFIDSPAPQVLHRYGIVLDANAAGAALFGYRDGEEMAGTTLDEHLLAESDVQLFTQRAADLQTRPLTAPALPAVAYRLRSRTGDISEVRGSEAPIQVDGMRAVLSTFIDDTAQHQAERGRADAQFLMARIVAVSPYGIALLDLDSGKFALVNPEFERITGHPRDALMDQRPADLRLWKDPARAAAQQEAVIDAGVVHRLRTTIVTRTGEERALRGSGAVFALADRHYLLYVLHDVTQEEQLELESKAVLDTSPAGIFVARNGQITLASRSLEQMVGWPAGTAAGRSAASLVGGEAALQQVMGPIRAGLARGESVSFLWPLFHGDGTPFTARFTGRLIDPQHPDARRGVVWIVQDVSEEVERGRLLERARIDAQTAAQAKTRFLVHTSHHLRTPLNAVLNLAELARDTQTDAHQRVHLVGHIASTAQTLAMMLGDILDLQLIEEGELQLDLRDFDLGDLADKLRTVYSAQATVRGLRLSVTLSPGADRWVHGDPQRVRQLLGHYMSNAVRFSETGLIQLRIHALQGDRYRFEVQDQGPGIAPEEQEQLFQPFTAIGANNVVSRAPGGVGLGLAIARRLAEAMGGHTGVQSAPGEGATFWAELPLQPAQAPQVKPDGYDAPLRGVRLLLAEDDELSTASMTLLLERWGAHVDAVSDGTQAVRAVSAARGEGRPYDLVLMDLHMPLMDGLDATRWIREQLNEQSLPVIALTAGMLQSEIDAARQAGCSDFLTKPVTASTLLGRMISLIAGRTVAP